MKNKKILVIDDEPDILDLFTRVLKEYTVETAENEKTALKLLSIENFDLIFMDVIIPNVNTIDLFKTIRKIRPKSKIIIITGFAVEEEIKQITKLGAVGVMHKPFDHIDDIKSTVKHALDKHFKIFPF